MLRRPGVLSILKERVGKRNIYYVALQENNNARACISSHLSRAYAEAMKKKLKEKFKEELKNYQSNQYYLVRWLVDYIIEEQSQWKNREFAFR